MSGFTTAFPNSLKGELPQAIHNFANGGDTFKVALGKGSPVGTYDATTTNYSALVSNGDEVPNGASYTTGGFAWTNGQNITPTVDNGSHSAYWQWSVNPQWLGLTAVTLGCLLYTSSKANRCVGVFSFGTVQSPTSQDFTLLLPVNAPGTALIRIE